MNVGRLWVGTVLPAVLVLAGVLPWVLAWGDLPDPMASHFAVGGEADGSTAKAVLAGVTAGLAGVTAVLLAVAARRPSPALAPQAAILAFVGTLVAALGAATVAVNRHAADWREVTLALGWAVVAVGAALGVTALAARAAASYAPPPEPEPEPEPGLGLAVAPAAGVGAAGVAGAAGAAAGKPLRWAGSARGRGLLAVGAGLGAAGAGALVAGAVAAGVVLLPVGAVVSLFASVEVEASSAGVRVRAALPWPRVTVPLEEIEAATAVAVRPLERGGWGYRGSLRLVRRAAWVVRAGPALELHLTGRRRFTVTVDDADAAAAVVNALVTSRPPRSRGRGRRGSGEGRR